MCLHFWGGGVLGLVGGAFGGRVLTAERGRLVACACYCCLCWSKSQVGGYRVGGWAEVWGHLVTAEKVNFTITAATTTAAAEQLLLESALQPPFSPLDVASNRCRMHHVVLAV